MLQPKTQELEELQTTTKIPTEKQCAAESKDRVMPGGVFRREVHFPLWTVGKTAERCIIQAQWTPAASGAPLIKGEGPDYILIERKEQIN